MKTVQKPQSTHTEIALSIALQEMQKDAKKALTSRSADTAATAHIDFLLKELAQLFLTPQQQQTICTILELHNQCLYPLCYTVDGERKYSR